MSDESRIGSQGRSRRARWTRSRRPRGELIIGDALIAFYPSPRSAKQAEPEVLRNAGAFGGKPERRGAVTVLWIRPPPNELRAKVLACVFT